MRTNHLLLLPPHLLLPLLHTVRVYKLIICQQQVVLVDWFFLFLSLAFKLLAALAASHTYRSKLPSQMFTHSTLLLLLLYTSTKTRTTSYLTEIYLSGLPSCTNKQDDDCLNGLHVDDDDVLSNGFVWKNTKPREKRRQSSFVFSCS